MLYLGGNEIILWLISILPPLCEVPRGFSRRLPPGVSAVAGQVASLQCIVVGLVMLKAVDGQRVRGLLHILPVHHL